MRGGPLPTIFSDTPFRLTRHLPLSRISVTVKQGNPCQTINFQAALRYILQHIRSDTLKKPHETAARQAYIAAKTKPENICRVRRFFYLQAIPPHSVLKSTRLSHSSQTVLSSHLNVSPAIFKKIKKTPAGQEGLYAPQYARRTRFPVPAGRLRNFSGINAPGQRRTHAGIQTSVCPVRPAAETAAARFTGRGQVFHSHRCASPKRPEENSRQTCHTHWIRRCRLLPMHPQHNLKLAGLLRPHPQNRCRLP